jgi:hypothetical protein
MFALELVRGEETRTFSMRDAGVSGWELTEKANGQPIRTVQYSDWHRVERAISMILLQADALEQDGWRALGLARKD